MPFGDLTHAIDRFSERSREQAAWVCAETHCSAHIFHSQQIAQFENNRVGRVGIELRRIGIFDAADIARVFNRCALHTQTDAEEGDLLAARVTDRADHPGDAAFSEPAWNKDRIDLTKAVLPSLVGHQLFALDPTENDP